MCDCCCGDSKKVPPSAERNTSEEMSSENAYQDPMDRAEDVQAMAEAIKIMQSEAQGAGSDDMNERLQQKIEEYKVEREWLEKQVVT